MSSIPEKIRQEIILRLPVESIARFKCVCKSWNTYITSPKFIKDHHIRTSRNPRIMMRYKIEPSRRTFHIVDYDSISSAALSSCKCETVGRLNYPVLMKNGVEHRYSHFMGSCNGLLCLEDPKSRTPILWNPSTGEYKEIIPQVDNFGRPSSGLEYYLWPSTGFCYDGEIDDYKLVCIASNRVYVYTLKSGSWRKLDKDIPRASGEPIGLVLNGSLHWLHATGNAIVAFDISSEEVTNLLFPEEIIPRQTDSNYDLDLRVLGDSLCIVSGVSAGRVDVWVMQNYGVTESWTKLFTTTLEVITKRPRHQLKFYRYFTNGDILMQVCGRFGLYDPKNDTIRYIDINGFNERTPLLGEIYVESLVSLNSGTYFTKKSQMHTKYTSNKRRREEITDMEGAADEGSSSRRVNGVTEML